MVSRVTHKFAIGEAVDFRPGRNTSAAHCIYIVIKLLPENDGETEYQVRSPFEPQAAIRIVACSRRHASTTNDHSPGLIIFLSRELGTVLPQPAYIGVDVSDDFCIHEEVRLMKNPMKARQLKCWSIGMSGTRTQESDAFSIVGRVASSAVCRWKIDMAMRFAMRHVVAKVATK
jgi:hypothetical protein